MIYSFLIYIISLLSFDSVAISESFEGYVEYNISYPNQRRGVAKTVAVKFRIFYKDGNIRKEYLNKFDSVFLYSVYLYKENMHYSIMPGSDTVEYYNPSSDDMSEQGVSVDSLSDKSFNDLELLGYSCEKYVVRFKYDDAPEDEDPMTYNYWVAKHLIAASDNKLTYGANFIFPLSGHIILKYTIDIPVLKVVEATSINKQSLSSELFNVDLKGKELVEI